METHIWPLELQVFLMVPIGHIALKAIIGATNLDYLFLVKPLKLIWAPVDFTYGSLIFNWIRDRRLDNKIGYQDSSPSNNSQMIYLVTAIVKINKDEKYDENHIWRRNIPALGGQYHA